jgi:hypothetical protein
MGLLLRCSTFGTGGVALHDIAARLSAVTQLWCEARKGLAKSAFGVKDTRINTFPAWKLEHHFVELMSCRRFGRIGQNETPMDAGRSHGVNRDAV